MSLYSYYPAAKIRNVFISENLFAVHLPVAVFPLKIVTTRWTDYHLHIQYNLLNLPDRVGYWRFAYLSDGTKTNSATTIRLILWIRMGKRLKPFGISPASEWESVALSRI